jgi:hypothetical protein
LVDFIINLFIPKPIGKHTGQHDAHIDRPRKTGQGVNPAHSAAGLDERFTPVKPGIKVYVLANFETIATVDLDAEPFKTNIPGLSLKGIDITRHIQALPTDRKFKVNTFIAPSFRKVEPHLCLLLSIDPHLLYGINCMGVLTF